MIEALEALNYREPSKIQLKVIPRVLRGESLLARSPTGSGKTHAYLVPIIDRIDLNKQNLQALIIAPSRELARQIDAFAREFVPFFPGLKIRLYTSETSTKENIEGRTIPPHIAIGTPGRLADLFKNVGLYSLKEVRTLVLDEADLLAENDYFSMIQEVTKRLPSETEVLVFLATLNPQLQAFLGKEFGSRLLIDQDNGGTSSDVTHFLLDLHHQGVVSSLVSFLKAKPAYSTLIFASSKDKAHEIYEHLKHNGYPVLYFGGDLDARERKRALKSLKNDEYPYIVSTDLLSRGMDLPSLDRVISIDLPNDLSFYAHRSGRTGRFGRSGESWVFLTEESAMKAKTLLDNGVPFIFYALKGGEVVPDKRPIFEKKKNKRKKELPKEEIKEIKIVKARFKSRHVEPMHRKKQAIAIERVKERYRQKAIRAAIQKKKKETKS